MPRTIQVFEHERLTLTPNQWGEYLSDGELDKLYSFNDKNENIYFTGIRDGIKFKNFVGVIQIGGLTLEILPKADKRKDDSPGSHKTSTRNWRNALLRMLAICRKIKLDSVSEATLEKRHHSILDLYFEIFLDEVERLLHQGLIKKYRLTAGNVYALRGRLDFGKHIHKNLIHQERFFTDHEVYDQDHLINQILLRAVRILDQITTSPYIKDRVARVNLDFPEVKELEVQSYHFDQVIENRKTSSYKQAIQIAKMIILNYSPDIKSGHENMLALLFDMNKLWEEYISRVLAKSLVPGLGVAFQNTKSFWKSDTSTKTIKPDLVLTKGNETYVIDTKWKVIDSSKPDDSDLKQIFAYNIYWKSYHSMLLYPTTAFASENNRGNYEQGMDKVHGCTLAFVNVLNSQGKLNIFSADEILKVLNLSTDKN
jgi:5-methylcytosine-specific restriction enzyme subunit McrC